MMIIPIQYTSEIRSSRRGEGEGERERVRRERGRKREKEGERGRRREREKERERGCLYGEEEMIQALIQLTLCNFTISDIQLRKTAHNINNKVI